MSSLPERADVLEIRMAAQQLDEIGSALGISKQGAHKALGVTMQQAREKFGGWG